MGAIHDAWKMVRNILTLMNVWDFVDIIVVAVIIYALLMFVRRTNTGGVFKGIIVLLILLGLSDILNLSVVNYLLGKTMEIGVLALVVLFAPEIRRFLSQMGSRSIVGFLRHVDEASVETCIERVVAACTDMSKERTGALIVFQRDIQLQDFVRTGTVLPAEAVAGQKSTRSFPDVTVIRYAFCGSGLHSASLSSRISVHTGAVNSGSAGSSCIQVIS